ncbi:SAM-dependent methyltransferase [Methylobrevis albus]|uniref:Class I SAM-dependent methyltransferase n=1 Tax=Methylobrevis albus TaxID=2793297 RepID=A0A931I1R0_9HYPH|nr:cyclopropane-fatty-acyl-phospholipid synthase family protein [Methylobrevis albus]MBH0237678.1 class I SAM-dependent methyltransferase [Methylobrevis albus]
MPTKNDDRLLGAARRLFTHLLEIAGGGVGVELWDGSVLPAGRGDDPLRIAVAAPAAITRLVRRPRAPTLIDLYAEGLLDIRGGTLFDLAAARPAVASREIRRRLDKRLVLSCLLPFLFAKSAPALASLDGGRDASRARGSGKADIAFHYDVSNRFYELFLDPAMVYTCAYFRDWSGDLATAQADKLDMICRKLRLQPGDRLLDIGCGWGALIGHAAEHYGVTALGVTLSAEQAELARTRLAARGLAGRTEVRLVDYREVEGPFDKISSIGMFEHVGIAQHAAYFSKIRELLRPGGVYLHHAITRRGKRTEKAFGAKRAEYEAMTRYIFPGAEVDHIGMTLRNLEGYGFEVHDVEGWREHYGRTTELWARRLIDARDAAIAEVGEAKYRLWVLYLSGVSLAFQRGTLQIFQTVATRRGKGPSGMPPTREDLYR